MHPPPKDWMGFTPAGVPHMSGVSAGKASQKDGAGQVELTPVESVEGKGDTAKNTAEIMASAPRKGSEDHTTPPGMLQVPYGAVVLLFAAPGRHSRHSEIGPCSFSFPSRPFRSSSCDGLVVRQRT